MSQKIKLKQRMDLLKIYEDGNFNEFKEKYLATTKEIRELGDLKFYFESKYFPEMIAPDFDFTKISYEDFCKLDINDQFKYLQGEEDHIISKEGFLADPNIQRFVELAEKYNTGVNKRYNKTYIENGTYPKEVSEFLVKYFFKKSKNIYYKTFIEEAEEAGYQEVIDFIKENPLNRFAIYSEIDTRIKEQIKKIRDDSGLSSKDFANKLGISEKTLKYYEKNPESIDIDTLVKYADMANKSVNDLLYYKQLQRVTNKDNFLFKEYLKNVSKE